MSKSIKDSKGKTKYIIDVDVGGKSNPSMEEINKSIASITKNFSFIDKTGRSKVSEEFKSLESYGLKGKYTLKDPIISINKTACEIAYDCKFEGPNGYWCMPTMDFNPHTLKFDKYVAIND